MYRGRESNPYERFGSQDFLTNYDFRRSCLCMICGLDFLFTIAQFTLSRRYRLLSLYTFPDSENIRNGTWLGIAIVQKVSPNLSDSTPNVSAWALKLLLSPACLPVPPPRRVV